MVLVPDEVSQPARPAEKQWFFDLADRAADHVAMRDMSLTILHFRLHHKNRFQFARAVITPLFPVHYLPRTAC